MTTDTTPISAAQQEMLDSLRRGRPAAGQDPAKRQQIIDGARRIFIDMGFDAAPMNDITHEASVSKARSVYFASKEELFEALIDEERCAIFNDLYQALEQAGDVRDTLIRFGVALVTKITSETVTRAQRTVIGICERIPELGARFYERGPKHGHAKLMTFLNIAIERGHLAIADVELAAYQLTELSLAGIYRQRLFGGGAEPPSAEEIRKTVTAGVDVFLKAYGAVPAKAS